MVITCERKITWVAYITGSLQTVSTISLSSSYMSVGYVLNNYVANGLGLLNYIWRIIICFREFELGKTARKVDWVV